MLRVGALAERVRLVPAHGAAVKAVLATAAVAWLLAIGLAVSSTGRDFDHSALDRAGHHPWLVVTLAGGWVLMVAAMMLPTTLPLVSSVGREVGQRAIMGVLAGYVAIWLIAGLGMHAGDLGVHWLVHRSTWLSDHTWTIAAGTLAIAGVYQFSAAKSRFLGCCRAPDRLIGERTPLIIGFGHGMHCLACCWALMLVMFSVGVAGFAWMLALSAVMVAEKVTPIGHRASAPVGVWLLCCSALTAVAA